MLLWLLACRPPDGAISSEPVASARLERVNLRGMALLGGPFGGSADLVVEPVRGRAFTVPVALRGGTFGLGVELVPFEPAAFGIPLQLPDREVIGDELMGRYRGSAATLSVIAGVEVHHLKNQHDVEIDAATLPFGVGVMLAAEWLTLDPRETVLPTDTGDATDTGAP